MCGEAGARGLRGPGDSCPTVHPGAWSRYSPAAHLCPLSLPRVVDISLPRFSITGTYDLKKTLSQLGITRIFEDNGDLTRIVPNRTLKVGEVSPPPHRPGTGRPNTAPSPSWGARPHQAEPQPSAAPTSRGTALGRVFSVFKRGPDLLVTFWKLVQCNQQ